jgi:quinone-modifying oxidoreductase subunit QmoA
VAEVEEDIRTHGVWLTVEDAVQGNKLTEQFDLVVLATGMQPSLAGQALPLNASLDEEGFVVTGDETGIYAAGCAKEPLDVMKSAQSATGAALKAIQTVKGR